MVFVLSAVVPWAFRNAKAFQGVGQKAGKARCSLAIALGPSFLSHLKQGQGKQILHRYKGVGNIYYCNMEEGYSSRWYVVTRVGFWLRVLLLSWGFFPDSDRALLYWEAPIDHLVFGLSTFIPMGFLGFLFFLYPSTYFSTVFIFLYLGLEGG
jgi:hypothetical protein